MPILGSSNPAANKIMMSKIRTNAVQLSGWVEDIVGKREICLLRAISPFPTLFSKVSVVDASK